MKSTLSLAAALIATAVFTAAPADAAIIDELLGDQDFLNGDVLLGSFAFNAASAGEPVPFDMFRGSDPNTDFSESWTFGYAPIVDPLELILSASIEFGIYDHDAAHTGGPRFPSSRHRPLLQWAACKHSAFSSRGSGSAQFPSSPHTCGSVQSFWLSHCRAPGSSPQAPSATRPTTRVANKAC